MNLRRLPAYLSLFVLWGCASNPARLVQYSAVVEAVEDARALPMQDYSLQRGQEPLTVIRLRLLTHRDDREPRHLTIVALGLHSQEELGEAGDQVTFLIAGGIPQSGELSIEQLVDYRIVHARGLAESRAGPGAPCWIANAPRGG